MEKSKERAQGGSLSGGQGFTLIEMAIVLIIIGIIIGAVVKGKDLVRSAEQKKVYSKFLNEWRVAYLNFYDRTGKILGDHTGSDGQADTSGGSDDLCTGDTTTTPPNYYGLSQVGLTCPTTNTGKDYQYRYTDSTGAAHLVTIAFKYDTTGKYNYMEITQIPNELCMAIDRMIDGEADGTAGDFIGDATSGKAWDTTPEADTTARWKMEF